MSAAADIAAAGVGSEAAPPRAAAVKLSAGYHQHAVIRDIDLEVRPGEVVALLGPNGAGKTTTLKALAGHLKPIEGEVRFDGLRVTSAPHVRARRGMAYVTEERSVFSQLTAADNLRIGWADVDHATELFPELRRLLRRKGGQLSGGEQQMLTLGRALSRNPSLLLADELSLGLAPIIVQRLLEAARAAAHEKGVGVLIVEQHVRQALRFADRVYLMRRGAIVGSGAADEIDPQLREVYL
jgi:branched-chain amino acid transport system ATP-binding protein